MQSRAGLLKLVSLVWALNCTAPARAGNFAHGGDVFGDQNNPWFLGDSRVEYCVPQPSPNYPLSWSDARQIVTRSFEAWNDFTAKYGFDRGFWVPADIYRYVPPPHPSFAEKAACDGSPREIQFLFGLEEKVPVEARIFTTNRLAIAMGAEQGRPAFVFIRAWTDDPSKIHHLTLHEIGHILGMPHDSVHVMAGATANRLTEKDPGLRLGIIESPSWPFRIMPSQPLEFLTEPAISCVSHPGFSQSTSLPRRLKDLLTIPADQACFRLRLVVEPLAKPPAFTPTKVWETFSQDRRYIEFAMTLQIDFPDSARPPLRHRGVFDWRHHDFKANRTEFSPRQITIAKVFAHDESMFVVDRSTLMLPNSFPYDGVPEHGYFSIRGETVPAVVLDENGFSLKIFDSIGKRWWLITDDRVKESVSTIGVF